MLLVFDSTAVRIRDRHSAMVDAITSAAGATLMTPERGNERLHLQLHPWNPGGVEVVEAKCSAHTLRRSARETSDESEPLLLLTCGHKGQGIHRQLDQEMKVQPAGVWATNLSRPYVHHVTDTWTTTAKISERLLGVPPSLVGTALYRVGASPLAPLFSQHVAHVRQVADEVNETAAAALGTATLALARALLTSVSGAEELNRQALDDVLLIAGEGLCRQSSR